MEPTASVSYLLQHAAAMMTRQSDQVLQERLGIGMSQLKILMLLSDEPTVQQRKLADCLGQTEASISRQIKLMAEKGFLQVMVNPKSKREHITVLTPKGNKITGAAREVLAVYDRPLVDALGEKKQKQLYELLAEIHDQVCAAGKPFACDRSLKM